MTVEELYYFLEENLENGTIDNETEIRFSDISIANIKLDEGAIYLISE